MLDFPKEMRYNEVSYLTTGSETGKETIYANTRKAHFGTTLLPGFCILLHGSATPSIGLLNQERAPKPQNATQQNRHKLFVSNDIEKTAQLPQVPHIAGFLRTRALLLKISGQKN